MPVLFKEFIPFLLDLHVLVLDLLVVPDNACMHFLKFPQSRFAVLRTGKLGNGGLQECFMTLLPDPFPELFQNDLHHKDRLSMIDRIRFSVWSMERLRVSVSASFSFNVRISSFWDRMICS